MPVKISVIVPVYNADLYLKTCVSSILNQTFRELEVILVDDGSTDRSGSLCNGFAESDNRVHVLHQTNQGAAASRNAGLEIAGGEYIGFVDADDWIEPDMVETMFENAKEHDSDMVYCNYIAESDAVMQTVDMNSGKKSIYHAEDIKQQFLPYFFGYQYNELSNYKNYCTFADYNSYIWLCIYKREIIKKLEVPFPSERIYFNEDNLFNLRFVYHANTITHVNHYFYHYRFNQSSFTKTFNQKYFENKLNKYGYLSDFIKNNHLEKGYEQRLNIKICVEVINLINYYVNTKARTLCEKLQNIVSIINTPLISSALKDFDVRQLSFSQMKVFLYFAKKKAYPVLLMLSIGYGLTHKHRK